MSTLDAKFLQLHRCRWHATAELLERDRAAAPARAAALLRLPVYVHTPIDRRALAVLRAIARG